MDRIGESGTLAVFARVKQLIAEGKDIISLSVGELDCDTPEFIAAAGKKAIDDGHTRYTVNHGTPELRKAIADKLLRENGLSYSPDEIIVSAGSKQALFNMLYATCGPGDEVIIFAPNYTSHPDMVQIVGAEPVFVHTHVENEYQIMADDLEAAITDKTRLIILNTPNNPTGQIYNKESFAIIAEAAEKHDLWIASDELYEKIVFDPYVHRSIAQDFPQIKRRSMIGNGVSKTYAMTGWRVGFGAAPLEVIKKAALIQSHTTNNACAIAQKAALAAYTDDDGSFFASLIPELRTKRDVAYQIISEIPDLKCPLPQGAFYLFPDVTAYFGKKYKDRVINGSMDLALYLLEELEVAIVPGVAFGQEGSIRISFATDLESIEKGCGKIKTGFEQLG